MQVNANGGSRGYLGPYTLNVGCFNVAVSFTDNPAFILDVPLWVGDSVTEVYEIKQPSCNRAWCSILSNTVVNPDFTGTAWTPPVKLNQCSPQPCVKFSLVDTIYPEVVTFKIKTTWTNTVTHLSPQATITITCGNFYTITEQPGTLNPQVIPHNDNTRGFILPTWICSQEAGCPVS
jgi:hypothetical protein